MNASPCQASGAALYRARSPEHHPSSAGVLRPYSRDTQPLHDLAYASHPPHDAVFLQNGTTGRVASTNWFYFILWFKAAPLGFKSIFLIVI